MPPTPAGAAPTLAAPDRDHDNGPVDLTALTPPQLQARRTMKWTTYPPDVLALWVAEMDYPTAEPVMAAIRAAVAAETFGYPMNPAASGLPEAYAGWALRRYGMTVDPADVHVVADVMHGVRLALEYFTAPDDPVIITTPVYMPFFDIVDLARRPQVHVPMATGPDGRAALDLDRINAAFAAGARTLLLCSPYNPLGRAFSPAELAALAEVVDRHGGRVVSDEIHAPLVHDDRPHVPYASVSAAAAAHTLTVVAASKAWNLPGLKCAQVLTSSPADRATWAAIPVWDLVGVSTLGMEASTAAYRDGEQWVTEVLTQLAANRETLRGRVAGWPGVRLGSTEATYLAWLDLTELGLTEEPAALLLREARVALSGGVPFRAPKHRFARLNYATTPTILDAALDRIEGALARLSPA